MAEWPKTYHPAWYDDGAYVVDESVTVEGYQVQPMTLTACATWCGGQRVFRDDGTRGVLPPGCEEPALLGDFVMRTEPWSVSRADGHYQRWALADGGTSG